MSKPQPPSVIFFMKRGFGYALTSVLSIMSGYIIKNIFNSKDLLLIGISVFLSFPFFIIYSICFYIEETGDKYNAELVEKNKKDSITLSIVIMFSFSLLLLSFFRIKYGEFPPPNLLISISIYAIIFLSYGYYIFKKFRYQSHEFPKIRHHLIWPAVLSIAFSFYFGIFFNKINLNNSSLFPIYILIAYFVLSEINKLSKRNFLIFGIILFFIASTISAFGIIKVEYLSAIIFSITISAYLAIFESWSITHQVARREIINSKLNQGCKHENYSLKNEMSLSKKYYLATFTSIIIIGTILPFQFVLSSSGIIFLVGYFFHSILSFIIWYRAGTSNEKLMNENWKTYKTIWGLIFLFIVVIDSKVNILPTNNNTPGFISYAALSILFASVIFFIKGDISKALKEREIGINKIFENRTRFVLLCPIICFFMCYLILALKDYQDQTLVVKSNLVYILYIGYIIITLIFMVGNLFDWWNKLKGIASNVWGIILLSRFFTSLAIGLFVFIPAISAEVGTMKAFFWSIPFFLAAAGGFSLNDYFDVYKDRINKPCRAIPSGKISRTTALVFGIILLLMSGIISFVFAKEWTGRFLQMGAIVGVILYNPLVKKLGVGKTIFTAILCTLPIIFIIKELDYSQVYWTLPFAVYCFINARELLMDLLDIKGDKIDGINTLPMKLGASKTIIISYLLQIVACFLILPIPLVSSNNYKIAITGLIYIAVLAIMTLWWRASDPIRKHLIKLSWIPMGFSLLLLL